MLSKFQTSKAFPAQQVDRHLKLKLFQQLKHNYQAILIEIKQLQGRSIEELKAIKDRVQSTCETAIEKLSKLPIRHEKELTVIRRNDLESKALITKLEKIQEVCLEAIASSNQPENHTTITTLQRIHNSVGEKLMKLSEIISTTDNALSEQQQLVVLQQEQALLKLLKLKSDLGVDLNKIHNGADQEYEQITKLALQIKNEQYANLFDGVRHNNAIVIEEIEQDLDPKLENIIKQARGVNNEVIFQVKRKVEVLDTNVEEITHQANLDHKAAIMEMWQIYDNLKGQLTIIEQQAKQDHAVMRSTIRQLQLKNTQDDQSVFTEEEKLKPLLFSVNLNVPERKEEGSALLSSPTAMLRFMAP